MGWGAVPWVNKISLVLLAVRAECAWFESSAELPLQAAEVTEEKPSAVPCTILSVGWSTKVKIWKVSASPMLQGKA